MGRSADVGGSTHLRSRRERGAVLLEAALITPIFVTLLFGIWTTARAWNVHNVLDHAAREAARFGATGRTHTEILLTAEGEVIAASFPWVNVDHCVADIKGGSVTVTRNDGGSGACMLTGTGPGQDPTSDDRVQVTLSVDAYPLNFVFWSTTVDLEARAVARLEP